MPHTLTPPSSLLIPLARPSVIGQTFACIDHVAVDATRHRRVEVAADGAHHGFFHEGQAFFDTTIGQYDPALVVEAERLEVSVVEPVPVSFATRARSNAPSMSPRSS